MVKKKKKPHICNCDSQNDSHFRHVYLTVVHEVALRISDETLDREGGKHRHERLRAACIRVVEGDREVLLEAESLNAIRWVVEDCGLEDDLRVGVVVSRPVKLVCVILPQFVAPRIRRIQAHCEVEGRGGIPMAPSINTCRRALEPVLAIDIDGECSHRWVNVKRKLLRGCSWAKHTKRKRNPDERARRLKEIYLRSKKVKKDEDWERNRLGNVTCP